MEQFQGSERLILQTIVDSPKDSAGYVKDIQIATASEISVEDVQNWLETLDGKGFVERAKRTDGFSALLTANGAQALSCSSTHQVSRASDSSQTTIKIVPEGIKSFDNHHADVFLHLLPDYEGGTKLPYSIAFWKDRIEGRDPGQMFRVGVIYGLSGCGKSSLVKAGLLPRLEPHVLKVPLDANGHDTEIRLLGAILNRCPQLPKDKGLAESLEALNNGQGLARGEKILIILDQFGAVKK